MRILNFWRQVAAVLRHAAYPKTPAEHWEEQAKQHKPCPQALEQAVNAAVKGEVPTMEAHGRTWHKGPPPHVGWWNASVDPRQDIAENTWRWWDGKHWTKLRFTDYPLLENDSSAEAATRIWWNDYYPDNAVVPRMTPEQWKERARASS